MERDEYLPSRRVVAGHPRRVGRLPSRPLRGLRHLVLLGPARLQGIASIYKNVYKAPPTGFSAFPVDPPRADSRDMSQPYAHRAEIERLDQRPGSTSGSAAREPGSSLLVLARGH